MRDMITQIVRLKCEDHFTLQVNFNASLRRRVQPRSQGPLSSFGVCSIVGGDGASNHT